MSSINEIAQRYRSLNFTSLADAFEQLINTAEANQQSYLQFATALVDCEIQQRNNKRKHLNRRKAEFPVEKHLEEFDYHYSVKY